MDKEPKLKIGQKRTKPQRYEMKRVPINHMSPKRKKESPKYRRLVAELIMKSGNKSELSEKHPDFRGLQCHHICGRIGKHYLNPFELIILTAEEHDEEGDHRTQERREYLLDFIKPIRISQGYKVEDYE